MLETQAIKQISKIDHLGPVSPGITDIGHDILYRSFQIDGVIGNLELDLENATISKLFGITVVEYDDDRSYEWYRYYGDRTAQLKRIFEDEKAKRMIAEASIKSQSRYVGRWVNG